jgi:adenine phosphoribosyltransferase
LTSPEDLKKYVRDVTDYPQKGIVFRDIKAWLDNPPDLVAGIEARGFIPGSAMSVRLDAGFVPIRKTGKLPWMTVMESYDLEYGTDQLEVHSDAVQPGQKVLIVDDVLATGGTASAAVRLMRKLGADVVGVQVLIELGYLDGRKKLQDVKLKSEIVYE